MANILTKKGKELFLRRTNIVNPTSSYSHPSQVKVGLENAIPTITDTDIDLPLPVTLTISGSDRNVDVIWDGASDFGRNPVGSTMEENEVQFRESSFAEDVVSRNLTKTATAPYTWRADFPDFDISRRTSMYIYIPDSVAEMAIESVELTYVAGGTEYSVTFGEEADSDITIEVLDAMDSLTDWTFFDGSGVGSWTLNSSLPEGREGSGFNLVKTSTNNQANGAYRDLPQSYDATGKVLKFDIYIKDTATLNKLASTNALIFFWTDSSGSNAPGADVSNRIYGVGRSELTEEDWTTITISDLTTSPAVNNPPPDITDLRKIRIDIRTINTITTIAAGDIIFDNFRLLPEDTGQPISLETPLRRGWNHLSTGKQTFSDLATTQSLQSGNSNDDFIIHINEAGSVATTVRRTELIDGCETTSGWDREGLRMNIWSNDNPRQGDYALSVYMRQDDDYNQEGGAGKTVPTFDFRGKELVVDVFIRDDDVNTTLSELDIIWGNGTVEFDDPEDDNNDSIDWKPDFNSHYSFSLESLPRHTGWNTVRINQGDARLFREGHSNESGPVDDENCDYLFIESTTLRENHLDRERPRIERGDILIDNIRLEYDETTTNSDLNNTYTADLLLQWDESATNIDIDQTLKSFNVNRNLVKYQIRLNTGTATGYLISTMGIFNDTDLLVVSTFKGESKGSTDEFILESEFFI